MKLATRTFFLQKCQGYLVPSKGLIKSWKIITGWNKEKKNVMIYEEPTEEKKIEIKEFPIPKITLDNFILDIPHSDPYLIDWTTIRQFCRDLIPMSIEETRWDSFEQLLFGYQLYAVAHYQGVDSFFDYIFTKDINKIIFDFGDGPDEIEVEEVYWDRSSK
jgi:hypothetical protein